MNLVIFFSIVQCATNHVLLTITIVSDVILQMVEVMEGTGVYWYPHQQAYCAACKNWAGYINAAIDIFFTKETLAVSCAKGNEKKGKNGHQPLDPLVIDALIGELNCILLVIAN